MFQPIAYLEWFDGRPAAASHDLGSSDLSRVGATDEQLLEALDELPAGGEQSVEELLADAYDVHPQQVVVTAGTTHANVLVSATALSDPAQVTGPPRVLVETPGYEPHAVTPASLGGDVWRFRRDDGWLDPDRVENAIDETVDLVICSNRHNPTGRLTGRETLAAVAEVCAAADATLLVDEVYAPYDDGEEMTVKGPFGGITAAGLPNAVVTNSVTKFLGLGGLRLGWAIADETFADRLRQTASHLPVVSTPSRVYGRRALATVESRADESWDRLAENHALLSAFVEERDDLTGTVPPRCPFGLFAHEHADGDAVSEAAWERDCLVVPGRFFGVPEAFRVSLGGEPAAMGAALTVLGDVLDELSQ